VVFEANPDLVLITLRLRGEDVRRARAEAKRLSIPYTHVIRGWVAEAATRMRKKAR
jgi:hypothetical protein